MMLLTAEITDTPVLTLETDDRILTLVMDDVPDLMIEAEASPVLTIDLEEVPVLTAVLPGDEKQPGHRVTIYIREPEDNETVCMAETRSAAETSAADPELADFLLDVSGESATTAEGKPADTETSLSMETDTRSVATAEGNNDLDMDLFAGAEAPAGVGASMHDSNDAHDTYGAAEYAPVLPASGMSDDPDVNTGSAEISQKAIQGVQQSDHAADDGGQMDVTLWPRWFYVDGDMLVILQSFDYDRDGLMIIIN